ncbi:hypothetical protein GW17_00035346 [Ensete ventricosum]|nr:hypothetical protein GW17_00035346 [Ensete ventricosum]
MEGWLYLFRSNRLGLQYSRKRYFVLDHRDNSLSCYRAAPTACTQVVALPLPSLTFCSMFSWSKTLSRRRSHMHSFALREMFHAKLGKCPSSDVSVKEQKVDISLSLTEDVEGNVQLPVENRKSEERTEGSQESDTKPASMSGSFLELTDAADEFFDFPDEPEYDKQEDMWPSDSQLQHQQPKLSTAAVLMKSTRWQGVFLYCEHTGSTTYSLALYYMTHLPVESIPLLKKFVRGDDAYRNSRFKLIPHITKVCAMFMCHSDIFAIFCSLNSSLALILVPQQLPGVL